MLTIPQNGMTCFGPEIILQVIALCLHIGKDAAVKD